MRIPAAIFAVLLFAAGSAQALEEIQSFDALIDVAKDGSMVVTETIRVNVGGQQIRRGIYRDFPTVYSGRWGLRVDVPFEVLSVKRDGRPEPWHTRRLANGLRIAFGSENLLLPSGPTTYEFTYRTDRQLGHFADFDELYWNVTGNDWAFPIAQASVGVRLPAGARVSDASVYTGPTGTRGHDFREAHRSACAFAGATTRPLQPGEGLTIAIRWQKGIVEAPSQLARAADLARSNKGVLIGLVGLLGALCYFVVAWWFVGRDPALGTVIPLYGPPDACTPQDARYLLQLGKFDQKSFAAAILNLAVQGALEIRRRTSGNYELVEKPREGLEGEERDFAETLFKDGSPLELVPRNHETVRAARTELERGVRKKNGRMISMNRHVWVIGILITLVPLFLSLASSPQPDGAIFMSVWLGGWTIGCAFLVTAAVSGWRSGNPLAALPLTLFAIPFLAGWVFGISALAHAASGPVVVLYVLAIVLCAIFQVLLKRPTEDGQRLRAHLSGFRRYLSVAEADRLALENPPERTPELFERFLPYALALGVEQQWAEQFAGVLDGSTYAPQWQSGFAAGGFDSRVFATAIGSSLAGAVAAASTSPRSSSGGGGSGSSGGGGGGGGGGGW